MELTETTKPIPYIIIDEYYSESELARVYSELSFYSSDWKWLNPAIAFSARDENTGSYLKSNRCIWLEEVYSDPKYSDILSISSRKVDDLNNFFFRGSDHWIFNTFKCLSHSVLLSYYSEGSHYKPHQDTSYLTSLTWVFNEPKKFSGGDLILHNDDEEIKIDVVNNRTVIFPSRILHEVTPVKMDDNSKKWDGRYCISVFMQPRLA